MRNRIIPFLCLALFANVGRVKAEPTFFGIVVYTATQYSPVLLNAGYAGATFLCAYFADDLINGPKRREKEQKKIQDHQEYLDQVRNWTGADFERQLRHTSKCGEFAPIPDEYLFEQFTYYQFPEFQALLEKNFDFEYYILRLNDEIKNKKKFDFLTTQEEDLFKDVVKQLAYKAQCQRSQLEYQERLHQERLKEERIKKQQQKAYQDTIQSTFNQQQAAMSDWREQYAQEIENIYTNESPEAGIVKKRYHALSAHLEGTDVWVEHQYELPANTTKLLNEHALNPARYTHFYGNQIQQVVHTELVAILDGTAQLRYVDVLNQDTQAFTTTLTLFADAGHLYNHAGRVDTAFSFVDFCWNMLDIAKTTCDSLAETTLSQYRFRYKCTVAGFKGAWAGAVSYTDKLYAMRDFGADFAHSCWHPIDTARDLVPKIKKCSAFIAQRLTELSAANEQWRNKPNNRQLYYWIIPTAEEIAHEKAQRREWLNETVETAVEALDGLAEFLSTEDGILQCVEKTSEVATEMALSWATGKAAGSLVKTGAAALASKLDELSKLSLVQHVPTNMGTMQSFIVLEATELARAAAVARALGDEFAIAGDMAGRLGSTGALFSDVISGGNKPFIPRPSCPLLDPTEYARIQKLFKVPIPGIDNGIHPSVAKLDVDKILNHIGDKSHNFHLILVDPKNEESLRILLSRVMQDGIFERVGLTDVYYKILQVSDKFVVIKGKLDDVGEIRVGTSWIQLQRNIWGNQ